MLLRFAPLFVLVCALPAQAQSDSLQHGVEAALSGRAPGIQATHLSGQGGEAVTVRIRSSNTPSCANDPLVVIDGVVVAPIYEGAPLARVQPGDIASIEVLKSEEAQRLYGGRARNGVIFITTHRRSPLAPAALALSAPAPNPTASGGIVTVRLEAPEAARVEVFDALGRRVRLVAPEATGVVDLEVPTAGLAAGVYVVRAQSGDERVSQRFTVQ